jgi:hypothetical protein
VPADNTDAPDANRIVPETPLLPAFAVEIATLPLDVAPLMPLCKVSKPPVASTPTPSSAEFAPAIMDTVPPVPLSPIPADSAMAPARPDVA